jgi:hypothetical protein
MTGQRLSEAAVRGRLRIADIADLPTIDVPVAGQLLGIGRDAAYAAAAAGQIPVLKLGRSLRVPVPKLLEMLGVTNDLENSEAGVTTPRHRDTVRPLSDRYRNDDPPAA